MEQGIESLNVERRDDMAEFKNLYTCQLNSG
jgi:hypothetical protein